MKPVKDSPSWALCLGALEANANSKNRIVCLELSTHNFKG
jgi:hypothetical protein